VLLNLVGLALQRIPRMVTEDRGATLLTIFGHILPLLAQERLRCAPCPPSRLACLLQAALIRALREIHIHVWPSSPHSDRLETQLLNPWCVHAQERTAAGHADLAHQPAGAGQPGSLHCPLCWPGSAHHWCACPMHVSPGA
jgi:hypothetical protein